MNRTSKPLTVFAALVTAVFSISAAIAVPILWRGWYYSQIASLRLVEATGYGESVIRNAFDCVMDYLLKGAPFSTGALLYSESGAAHFADCKPLFLLDLTVLTVSGVLFLCLVLLFLGSVEFRERFAFSPPLAALALTLLVVLVLGVWAFVDFESLFTAFHHLCFPGKTNWVFDPHTDEIIRILPTAFWARTAALIGGLVLGLEGGLALLYALLRRRFRPKSIYEELTGKH